MPRGNGTGPAGAGPMTGRAAGFCAGYSMPGFANPIPGRGYGLGRGMGFGFRGGRRAHSYGYGAGFAMAAPYSQEFTARDEIEVLQNQSQYLQSTLEEINKRISELETNKQD